MAFNAATCRANKWRKSALSHLEKARDIKRRAAVGDAYDWEVERVPILVRLARIDMRLSRSFRR